MHRRSKTETFVRLGTLLLLAALALPLACSDEHPGAPPVISVDGRLFVDGGPVLPRSGTGGGGSRPIQGDGAFFINPARDAGSRPIQGDGAFFINPARDAGVANDHDAGNEDAGG
jgi:hypothetical protein